MSVVKFEVVKPDWTKEAICLLIRAFKAQPILYDYKHKLYHNRARRRLAMQTIVKKLRPLRPGSTVENIKMKMGSIRSQYVAEIKKLKKSIAMNLENNSVPIYTPSVWWFNQMVFILRFIRKEHNIKNEDEIIQIIKNKVKNNEFFDEKEHNNKPEEIYLECYAPKRTTNINFKREKNHEQDDSNDILNDIDLFTGEEFADDFNKKDDAKDIDNNLERNHYEDCNKPTSTKRIKLDKESDRTIKSFCNWMSDELMAISSDSLIINDTKRELFDIIFQAKIKYNNKND